MLKKILFASILLVCTSLLTYAQCWKTIVIGGAHTLAIKTDGTLWATGIGAHGRLGDGTTTDRNYFAQVGSDNDWKHITLSGQASVAIKNNGTLWHWGGIPKPYPILGATLVPTQVGSDTDWVQVECGGGHCLALKSNGTIWAWGSNVGGALGNPTLQGDTIKQMSAETDWVYIGQLNMNNSAAIKQDGTLWTWGPNNYGQIGDSTLIGRVTPTKIGIDNNWEKISIGFHTVAKKSNGTFWVWGRNEFGQLGNGTNTNISIPMQMNQETDWKDVNAGYNETYALKTDNSLWSWGNNQNGQLGLGNFTNYASPQQVGNDVNWESLVCNHGSGSGGGIKFDKTAWVTGTNTSGQFGNGNNINTNVLIQLSCNPLSVSQVSHASDNIKVFPNPTGSILYIDADKNQSKALYNITGVPVLQTIGNQMDVSQLAAGVYFLKVGALVRKVIKE